MLATAVIIDMVLSDERCTIDGPRPAVATAIDAADRVATLGLRDVQEAARMLVALNHALAGDTPAMRRAIDAVLAAPDVSPDAVAAMTAIEGVPLLLTHDLPAANAAIDQGISRLITRPSIAPFSLFGVWTLLRTVVDDRADEARDTLRATFAAVRAINRAALCYADAVAAGRDGRPDAARVLLTDADALLAERPWWRRLLHALVFDAAVADGGVTRCRPCGPTSRRTRRRATWNWHASAERCCAEPEPRPVVAGVTRSSRRRCARLGSPAGRSTCSTWSSRG